jgi:outer membrane protein TolC
LQKQRNVKRGADILAKLEGRANLDSVPSQILRAKAAVASRETELSNALRDVENAQTEIRRLVGDREGLTAYNIELIPAESPSYANEPASFEQLIQQAMQNRSEVREAVQRAKIAAIEADISRNEMLPELNLILKSYLSALEGETGVERAFQQQWVNTAPGFAAGLEYRLPYGRRASQSRLTQRQIKLQKVNEEIEVALLAVVSETQVAARHLDSAYKTMHAAATAIESANADLDYQTQRWEAFALVEGDFSEGQTPVTLLDQLLDAQQRLSNAESIYSQSEFDFKKAQLALKRATGTILQSEQIDFDSVCVDNVPSIQINSYDR